MADEQAINSDTVKSQPIPVTLLDGLKKIEAEGTLPLFISRQLEAFLTEIGLFQSSMTPTDAWEALRQYRDSTPQTPREAVIDAAAITVTATEVNEQKANSVTRRVYSSRRAKRRQRKN